MTEDFRNSKKFVKWEELQEEYAKRQESKEALRKKAITYISAVLVSTLVALTAVLIYNYTLH
jgi:hypothetical protein